MNYRRIYPRVSCPTLRRWCDKTLVVRLQSGLRSVFRLSHRHATSSIQLQPSPARKTFHWVDFSWIQPSISISLWWNETRRWWTPVIMTKQNIFSIVMKYFFLMTVVCWETEKRREWVCWFLRFYNKPHNLRISGRPASDWSQFSEFWVARNWN